MTLGPIPIILNKTPEGDTLGNSAVNNASSQVNEDKKAAVDGSRNQTPFIGPQNKNNTQKSANNLKNYSDANLLTGEIQNTNAKIPTTLLVNTATGRVDGEAGGSVVNKGSIPVSNKDFSEDIEEDEIFVEETNIPPEFFQEIQTRDNKFTSFATMTYSVSLYLMGKQQYNAMVSTGIKSVQGCYTLLQSGGISTDAKANHGAIRSKNFFKRDYYIDDIDLKSLISGTSTSSAHNTFEINFTVTEPNGLTFLENLHGIVQEYNINQGINEERINYAAQNYLMVVRFYGYDKDGNQITGRDIGINETLTDLYSVGEKFIPFQFKGISFALENDVVKYRCEGVCPNSQIPFGVANSTVPFNTELQGQTLSDILRGVEEKVAEETDDMTAEELDAQDEELANNYQISLVEALNNEQKLLVRKKVYEHANVYKIEFEKDSGIGDSSVINTSEFFEKEDSAMGLVQEAQQNMLINKGFYDTNKKRFSIQAGTSIVQTIDMLIRASSYIYNQQNIKFDEKTGKVTKNENAKEVLQWYKIRSKLKLLEYDNKRNDYAYEITYVISRYQINNVRSPYFGPTKFRGVHKEYNYWLTGENTEVLDFKQDYNYLYFQTMGGDTGVPHLQNNARELQKRYYQRNSSESNQGGKNRTTEGAANAASILYSPADQAQARLLIVGDPDWFAQSDIFYAPNSKDVGLGPYLSDGSVNYDSSEVLFAVNYNTPVDYDLKTGLADPGVENLGRNLGSGASGVSRLSFIYRANTITTRLSGGQFTQSLEGTLMLFPTESQVETEKQEVNDIIEKTINEDPVADDMVFDYDFGEWVFKQELDESSDIDEDVGVEPVPRDD